VTNSYFRLVEKHRLHGKLGLYARFCLTVPSPFRIHSFAGSRFVARIFAQYSALAL
jgi:hypothetical protein